MFLAITIDLEPNIARIGPFLITWHGVLGRCSSPRITWVMCIAASSTGLAKL